MRLIITLNYIGDSFLILKSNIKCYSIKKKKYMDF